MPAFKCPTCDAKATYSITSNGGYQVNQGSDVDRNCIERKERLAKGGAESGSLTCSILAKEAQRLLMLNRR